MQHTVTTRRKIIIVAPPAMKGQYNITVSFELSDSAFSDSAFQTEVRTFVTYTTKNRQYYISI